MWLWQGCENLGMLGQKSGPRYSNSNLNSSLREFEFGIFRQNFFRFDLQTSRWNKQAPIKACKSDKGRWHATRSFIYYHTGDLAGWMSVSWCAKSDWSHSCRQFSPTNLIIAMHNCAFLLLSLICLTISQHSSGQQPKTRKGETIRVDQVRDQFDLISSFQRTNYHWDGGFIWEYHCKMLRESALRLNSPWKTTPLHWNSTAW